MSAAIFIVLLTLLVVRHVVAVFLVFIALFAKTKHQRRTAVELLRVLRPAILLRRW